MKCTKDIVITAYKVQYVDLREPKPRTPQEEIYTVDNEFANAARLVHVNTEEFVKTRYENLGLRVFSVERLSKSVIKLDLNQLYLDNLPAAEEERADS